ncbi:hypothetical protein DC345_29385 [Paenibacillus taichungensis]|uniref:Uncharacterized protein n=1 Tax=Paenibacillus taichungensis TaxID=484184 RepID=A0A329QCS3_9BACL|nr:hypothetical protein [Paenibacillus taichungensis]RAW10180.1 hypothetical protein DC345_29385 [Paenibacillus taichungensis]
MSFEFFIAADRPIPEIKQNGPEVLTVKDMIRMNVPDGPIPWKAMKEDAEVLYNPDPVAFNRFHLESAPYAFKIMSNYTDFNHIYTFDVSQLNLAKDLYNYISSLDNEINLEVWHLWFGYDNENEVITRKNLLRSNLTTSDFEAALNESWCIDIKS